VPKLTSLASGRGRQLYNESVAPARARHFFPEITLERWSARMFKQVQAGDMIPTDRGAWLTWSDALRHYGSAPEGHKTDRHQDARHKRAAIEARADATVARVRALTDDQIVPELAKVGLPFTTINEANREQHKERLLEKLLTDAEAESLSTRAWVEQCTPHAAAASALCVPRRPARPVPKLTSLASGRSRSAPLPVPRRASADAGGLARDSRAARRRGGADGCGVPRMGEASRPNRVYRGGEGPLWPLRRGEAQVREAEDVRREDPDLRGGRDAAGAEGRVEGGAEGKERV
jgi:hypothetical protein